MRVVRYRETETGLTDRKVIIENIPAAQYHAGCRLRFGPDGKLYITTGDATKRELAQKLDSLAGKTLRFNDDGTVPSDNPFVGQQNARPEIWSYGHRNAQGMDWQPGTNLMFQTEHGPSGFDGPGGGDEVNIVERGKNYGWPLIHHRETRAGLESPLIGVHAGRCAGERDVLSRVSFSAVSRQFLFWLFERRADYSGSSRRASRGKPGATARGKYGRIRDVAEGPDGAIYFSTSNQDGRGKPARDDDRIIRLVPVKWKV